MLRIAGDANNVRLERLQGRVQLVCVKSQVKDMSFVAAISRRAGEVLQRDGLADGAVIVVGRHGTIRFWIDE